MFWARARGGTSRTSASGGSTSRVAVSATRPSTVARATSSRLLKTLDLLFQTTRADSSGVFGMGYTDAPKRATGPKYGTLTTTPPRTASMTAKPTAPVASGLAQCTTPKPQRSVVFTVTTRPASNGNSARSLPRTVSAGRQTVASSITPTALLARSGPSTSIRMPAFFPIDRCSPATRSATYQMD
jgi:hypothetical protein